MCGRLLKSMAGFFFIMSVVFLAHADGGVAIHGTRIVFPQEKKQVSITLSNSSTNMSYLVQSWVTDALGNKSKDFVVTPPLYVSGPRNENMLRLIYSGKPLPEDRETLYYFTAKAIPSVDKEKMAGRSTLLIAAASRIKLFVRPQGLTLPSGEAPAHLSFQRQGNQLLMINPTPYYLTLVDIKAGSQPIKDLMIAPLSRESSLLPKGSGKTITFNTINDYGAVIQRQANIIE